MRNDIANQIDMMNGLHQSLNQVKSELDEAHSKLNQRSTSFVELGERALELSTRLTHLENEFGGFGMKITSYVSDTKLRLEK
jgi:uncharacterized coiled-coil DUF342 family protein